MEKNIEIGKRIKQRREELGMTQEELGNLLWLNKSTIQRYEAGKIAKIKLPVIHAMAKQLNVNPEWLILKTDQMGNFHEMNEWYEGGRADRTVDEITEHPTDPPAVILPAEKIDNMLNLKKISGNQRRFAGFCRERTRYLPTNVQ